MNRPGQRLPPAGPLERLSPLAWGLLLVLAALLLRAPIFLYPFFNGDEATYAALANAQLDGQPLYVGAVDHKPPLISMTYAVILGLCGRFQLHAVHLVSILVVAATGLLLGPIAEAWGMSRRAGRIAAGLYVAYAGVGPGKDMLAANAELFMLLPTAGAVLLHAKAMTRDRLAPAAAWLVGAGGLAGVAFLYKYQAGAILGSLVLLSLVQVRTHGRLRTGVALIGLGIGCALPLAVLLLRYTWLGELDALRFWAWTYPLQYAGRLTGGEVLANLVRQTALWALPCLALLGCAAWGGRRWDQAAPGAEQSRPAPAGRDPGLARQGALLWLLGGLAGVVAGGRFFLHYYLQLLPGLALLAAPGLLALVSPRVPPLRRGLVLVGLALPVLTYWVAHAADHTLRPRIPAYTRVYQAVGAWLQEHSHPEERVLVWGNSAELYHFAERRMGTRFPFCNYHSGKIWGTRWDEEGAAPGPEQQVAQAWPLLLDDLARRRPDWIIDAASGGLDRWRGHELPRYPQLWGIVVQAYRPVGQVQGVLIYRRIGN